MLIDYKGDVTVKIDGIAAREINCICYIVRNKVLMSHCIHAYDPQSMILLFGNRPNGKSLISMLDEVKRVKHQCYEIKTGMSRAKLSHLMDSETWMDANKR